jgi:hypothetical protein
MNINIDGTQASVKTEQIFRVRGMYGSDSMENYGLEESSGNEQ